MTIQQFVQRLRRRLGDTQADGKFTTTALEEFGSEAQRDIARRLAPHLLPELQTIDTGTLNTTESFFAITTDIAQLMSIVVYNSTNEDVEISMVKDMDLIRGHNVFYRADDKQHWGYFENGRIYIEPNRGGDKIKVRYVKAPVDVTDTAEMVLNVRWEDLCLDYGEHLARKMEERDQEAELALRKYMEKIDRANGGPA